MIYNFVKFNLLIQQRASVNLVLKMGKHIPDRWRDYHPIGKKIEGTRFIPFKVPLKEHVSVNVESEKRLDNRILLKNIPNLGLIIDLTNTNRYYNPKVFRDESVEHIKLMIPGQETPTRQLSNNFIRIVKVFLENNKTNDKLIGVHCTHGVNRTGYLICYYMISQMTIEPKEAMEKFANARGHQIERTNYIEDLQKLNLANTQNWRERINDREISKNSNRSARSSSNDRSRSRINSHESWRDENLRDKSRGRNNSYENRRDNFLGKNNSYEKRRNNSRVRNNSHENKLDNSRGRNDSYKNRRENSRGRNGTYRNSSDNSAGGKYIRSRSPHRNFKVENSFSTSDHVDGKSTQRYADHHCTMSERPRRINLDYYKMRPTLDAHRNNYKHD